LINLQSLISAESSVVQRHHQLLQPQQNVFSPPTSHLPQHQSLVVDNSPFLGVASSLSTANPDRSTLGELEAVKMYEQYHRLMAAAAQQQGTSSAGS